MDLQIKREEIKILESILHGIMVTDMQGHIIYCNPANVKIFGYNKSDIDGMSIRTLHDEDDNMTFRSLMNKIRDQKPILMRWHGIKKNGQRAWLDIRANRINGQGEEPDSCVISLHKIDQLKDTELELRKNMAFAETILDSTADAIISVNEKGEIIQINDAATRMFGYSREEMASRNVKILLPLSDTYDIDYYLGKIQEKESGKISAERKETEALRKDGNSFPVELSVSEVTWDVRIELSTNPHLRLKVEDDGEGFDPAQENTSGSGLPIMNHRARVLGGELFIHRENNRTVLQCKFPNWTS